MTASKAPSPMLFFDCRSRSVGMTAYTHAPAEVMGYSPGHDEALSCIEKNLTYQVATPFEAYAELSNSASAQHQ
jgi:hypothetical protein